MSTVTRRLILTGGRTGQTCMLGKLQFVDGVLTATGSDRDVEGISRYLARTYKAFPEGSHELAAQQEVDRANPALKELLHGTSEVQAKSGPSQGSAEIFSGVPAGQPEPAQIPTIDRCGTVACEEGPAPELASGDGHTHPGHDAEAEQARSIQEAVTQLNPTNDELWTSEGLPRVDAVARLVGNPGISRSDVDAAAPEFVRPQEG